MVAGRYPGLRFPLQQAYIVTVLQGCSPTALARVHLHVFQHDLRLSGRIQNSTSNLTRHQPCSSEVVAGLRPQHDSVSPERT